MKIIALAGYKNHGKTAAALALQNHFAHAEQSILRISFAGTAKSMLRVMGVPESSLFGTDEQKNLPLEDFGGVTGRHLMVTLATEWGREKVHPNLWVFPVAKAIKTALEMEKAQGREITVLIDDLRFQSEYDFLVSKDAQFIGVQRGELPGKMEDQHISEQLPYRFAELGIPVVQNDATLAELHQKVVAFVVPNP